MVASSVIIGSGFGDCGKGLITDFETRRIGASLVARFNGGAQAGHTVTTKDRRHVFGHISSGTFAGADTYLSSNFIFNPLVLETELESFDEDEVPLIFVHDNAKVTTLFDMRINEIRVRHDGVTQNQEFIEIVGQPDQPLCGLSLVAIEGELSSKGRVDFVISLDNCGSGDPCMLDSNGYFVAGGSGVGADLVLFLGTNILENGTQTILLVRDTQLTTGAPNNDVDADNDGVADIAPAVLGTLLDAAAVVDSDYFAVVEPDAVYFDASPVGPATDNSVAAGAARCPDSSDTDAWYDWVQLTSSLAPPVGCKAATPGFANLSPCGGDADLDGDFDLADFAAFQRCFGVASAACAVFDLDGDCTVGLRDLDRFRQRLEATGP